MFSTLYQPHLVRGHKPRRYSSYIEGTPDWAEERDRRIPHTTLWKEGKVGGGLMECGEDMGPDKYFDNLVALIQESAKGLEL